MKGEEVFVVTINEVSKQEEFEHDPQVFENIEDARDLLKKAKESAIKEYIDEDAGISIVSDNPDYFALCADEGWSLTHYEVTVTACKIQ